MIFLNSAGFDLARDCSALNSLPGSDICERSLIAELLVVLGVLVAEVADVADEVCSNCHRSVADEVEFTVNEGLLPRWI